MSDLKNPTLGFDHQFSLEDMALCAMALGIAAESFRRGSIHLTTEAQTAEAQAKCERLRGLLCAAIGSPDVQLHIDDPKK